MNGTKNVLSGNSLKRVSRICLLITQKTLQNCQSKRRMINCPLTSSSFLWMPFPVFMHTLYEIYFLAPHPDAKPYALIVHIISCHTHPYSMICVFILLQIRVVRPPNYAFAVFIGILLASIGCILYVRRKSLEFIYNKNYWAIGAVVNIH